MKSALFKWTIIQSCVKNYLSTRSRVILIFEGIVNYNSLIYWICCVSSLFWSTKRRVWKNNSFKLEKIPFMNNYGITLIRGNYGTSGQQSNLSNCFFNQKWPMLFFLYKIEWLSTWIVNKEAFNNWTYSGELNARLVWYSNGQKLSVYVTVQYLIPL